jgi:hypothetical protein
MADDYTIERTRSGFQYLIPGTERRTLPKCAKPEHSREGDQYVIPGAEPITTRELLSRLAGKPIRPRRAQQGLKGARLFQSASRERLAPDEADDVLGLGEDRVGDVVGTARAV